MIEGMKKYIASLGLVLIPGVAEAAASLQDFLASIGSFINAVVIPALFSLAFLFFIVNATRYFIIGGANEDAQKKARSLALWGLIAFIVMVSIWGIVNLLVEGFGIDFQAKQPPCPDYLSVAACIELQGQEAQWDPF